MKRVSSVKHSIAQDTSHRTSEAHRIFQGSDIRLTPDPSDERGRAEARAQHETDQLGEGGFEDVTERAGARWQRLAQLLNQGHEIVVILRHDVYLW